MIVHRRIPPEEKAAIIAAYREGESVAVIGRRYGRTTNTVYALASAAGLRRRPDYTREPAPLIPWYAAPPIPHALASVIVQVGAPCWRCKGTGSIEQGRTCPLCWGHGTQA